MRVFHLLMLQIISGPEASDTDAGHADGAILKSRDVALQRLAR